MAQICEPGGKGTFVYGEPWLPDDWHPAINATIYLLLLSWAFVGVAILADLFMSSIEEITSLQKTIMLKMDDKERIYRVAVWNATISNLTLMVRPLLACLGCDRAAPAAHRRVFEWRSGRYRDSYMYTEVLDPEFPGESR